MALIETGIANRASVRAALHRVGVGEVVETVDPAVVWSADRVVLPGVGAFGPGMARLRAHELVEPLRARITAGKPTLAVCLGMQLLAWGSEEAPGVEGLGVVPTTVAHLRGPVVPHLGWRSVRAVGTGGYLASGVASFAHSYAMHDSPAGWRVATSEYGVQFVAALERGDVLGCQFHPELSGDYGHQLLRRWLERDRRSGSPDVRVIACLDVSNGRVVKGVQFRGLRDAGDPAACAAAYVAQGADEIVVLDVSATPEGRGAAVETVRAVRAVCTVPLTVGGGVRSVADAERLLAAGADKVAINSAAVASPALLGSLADRFGRQCIVLALDARSRADGSFEVVVRSGREPTGLDAVGWARDAVGCGAGEILLTSIDRDGTGQGYDLALIAAIRGVVTVPIVASGGAATAGHLAHAFAAGANAALVASIVHDGLFTFDALKSELATAGVRVRR